jgi:hypothetical protein
MRASAKFSSIDRLALLLAAIAHDVDHPANTNQFEIDTLSDLALLHNDQSVLENHHLVTTFNIMLDTNVAFLSDVDLKQCVSHPHTSFPFSSLLSAFSSPFCCYTVVALWLHCVYTVMTLRSPPFRRSFLRKRIVSAVLSTDMVHHFDMCKKVRIHTTGTPLEHHCNTTVTPLEHHCNTTVTPL